MIVEIVTIAIAVFLGIVALWKARPGMDKFVRITNALDNLPAFMVRTDEEVAEIRAAQERVEKAVFPNHGSAIPDGISRLERDLGALLARMDDVEQWVQTESDEAETTHADLLLQLEHIKIRVKPEDSAGA
jgi:hypothetical protein